MLRLLNEPSFIHYIGDRNVRTLKEAEAYILDKPIAHYELLGFGLYLIEEKETRATIGICGLLQRETLASPDLGYALLPEHWGKGYALEAAAAVMSFGRKTLGMSRIFAITNPDNVRSIGVLEKLGFRFVKTMPLNDDEAEVNLFVSEPARFGTL